MTKAVIEEDLTIDGDLIAKESHVSIRGKITGDIQAKGVDVMAGGVVHGKVSAESVSVSGDLTGSVTCGDLSLSETARVEAELVAKTLTSQSGARVVGRVEIKKD